MNGIEKEIAVGYQMVVRGQPTFAKILNDYFYDGGAGEAISRPWNAETTRKQYINDYRKRLLPHLYSYTPLCDYKQEDVLRALRTLQRDYNYSDEVMDHYRNLFWRVYEVAVKNDIIEDRLHWREAHITGGPGVKVPPKKLLSAQKRTFGMNEEMKFLKWVKSLSPEEIQGELMGLLLMYNMPLRNSEACALNFDDVHNVTEENIPTIYVFKSTERDSNKLKAGGKTSNMMRILPLLDIVYEEIKLRRDYIQRKLDEGQFNLPDGYSSIDELPIACRGKNFCERCSTRDLTNYANEIFSMLEIGKEAINEAIGDLYAKSGIEEDSPTAYLFRKNALNHIWCLGFTRDEMEYCMGHAMSSDGVKRSDFFNDDNIKKLYNKQRNHPANCVL